MLAYARDLPCRAGHVAHHLNSRPEQLGPKVLSIKGC